MITTQKVLFYSLKLTVLNTFEQQLIHFNSIGSLRNLARVTNQFLASFGVFGSSNPWQCKLKLKYMKNPSFGALHSPFTKPIRDARKKIRGRNPTTSIFAWLCKILDTMGNHFRQPGFRTPCQFRMVCEIFLCTNSVRFLLSNILCNFLVSPCNQPRYFLLYLCIHLLGSFYIRRETEGQENGCFSLNTCKISRSKKYTELLLCLTFSFCFHFSFQPSNL